MQLTGIQIPHFQKRFSHTVGPGRILVLDGTSYHLGNHVAPGQFLYGFRINDTAIPHDCNNITVFKYFIQLMADIDNGHALIPQLINNNSKLFKLF